MIEVDSVEYLLADERQGIRAFLQRGETRLSTYQRVAGVFLNGAGLLILLPTVARETIFGIYSYVAENSAPASRLILIPWILSLAAPLYAFYLLLRDLVEFYFVPRFLTEDKMRMTRFSLAGLTLPIDEGQEAKAAVLALESTRQEYSSFITGESRRARRSVDRAFAESKSGLAAYPMRRSIMQHGRDESIDMGPAESIGTLFSQAGSLDLSLVEEVARMEVSLARHSIRLRRLVLRYSKALILFLWTTLASLAIAAMLANPEPFTVEGQAVCAYAAYAVWCATSVFLVRLPRRWIDALAPPVSGSDKADHVFRDPDLHSFEVRISWVLGSAGFVFAVVAICLGTLGSAPLWN